MRDVGEQQSSSASPSSVPQVTLPKETLAEKKRRIFKWTLVEEVKLPMDFVKTQLLKYPNVIKFLSSFHDFNRVTLVWGCNENLSQGLHIHKNFQNFYADDEADKSSDNNDHLSGALGSQSEGAMRQLVNLSKRQRISGDDMVLFQSLLQHWQDTLLSQRTAKEEFGSVKLKGKLTYERVDKHERPTLMMSMLNSHVNEAAANGRFGLCLTPDGRVFSLGKDFRDHLANVDER